MISLLVSLLVILPWPSPAEDGVYEFTKIDSVVKSEKCFKSRPKWRVDNRQDFEALKKKIRACGSISDSTEINFENSTVLGQLVAVPCHTEFKIVMLIDDVGKMVTHKVEVKNKTKACSGRDHVSLNLVQVKKVPMIYGVKYKIRKR